MLRGQHSSDAGGVIQWMVVGGEWASRRGGVVDGKWVVVSSGVGIGVFYWWFRGIG